MIWSKLRKAVENLLADSVREHVQVHLTCYASSTYFMTRAWVTWDKEEIATFSTIKYHNEQTRIASLLSDENEDDVREQFEYLKYNDSAAVLLKQKGLYATHHLLSALETYVSLTIDEALRDDDVLIRAWAKFDRRLGKRRLREMNIESMDRFYEQKWYQLRCSAEGIHYPEVNVITPVDTQSRDRQ